MSFILIRLKSVLVISVCVISDDLSPFYHETDLDKSGRLVVAYAYKCERRCAESVNWIVY